ncbi:hypothetical protein DPMN_079468 [Dreissena polymorpha]|uniref:Uncharacterized protein n=1 Tax=Dreissena polymorpha TaxID=45954 RepID=A0A9D3YPK0_DREPO|nr:hypothetical protein DPMN_079468 [Dreissena polymorpha]
MHSLPSLGPTVYDLSRSCLARHLRNTARFRNFPARGKRAYRDRKCKLLNSYYMHRPIFTSPSTTIVNIMLNLPMHHTSPRVNVKNTDDPALYALELAKDYQAGEVEIT